MSVYTKINEEELEAHLLKYQVGKSIGLSGISDGIENTNYLLKTDKNEYIFTIFENLKEKEVEKYLLFMNHLNKNRLACPNVIRSCNGNIQESIKNKPAAIIQKLEGKSVVITDERHCEKVGNLLAEFHIAGSGFNGSLVNTRGLEWCKSSYIKLRDIITEQQSILIKKSLFEQEKLECADLPKSTIHADLFRDNVLFYKSEISGMIDFYYSCYGFLIYDLAVVINDWCSDSNGRIIKNKYINIINSYDRERKITQIEKILWKQALISSALRFYLSRLLDLHFPKVGEMTHIKDPSVFEMILQDRLKNSYHI